MSLDFDQAGDRRGGRSSVDSAHHSFGDPAHRVPVEPKGEIRSLHALKGLDAAEAVREDREFLVQRARFQCHENGRHFWPNRQRQSEDCGALGGDPIIEGAEGRSHGSVVLERAVGGD